MVDDGAVALCAETLGSMQQAFDLAVEYAKDRVQFDRPIATFQAIKHKAAEMLERIELSRVGVHYAAWASQVDDPVRAEAAAMAKSFVAAGGQPRVRRVASRSTAASGSRGTATPTCTTAG